MAGFKAAALVNRHVDQHRAGLHAFQHVARHQFRRGGAGDQHGPDHQIGLADHLLDIGAVGKAGLGAAFEMDAEPLQHFRIAVEDGHVRAEAHGHLRRVEAHHAAADHQHAARQHARNPAQQHAAPAVRFFQCSRPGLDRHAPGNLAHRFQQRQGSARAGDRFISDGSDARLDQIRGLLRIGREVEIGVEHLALAQPGPLRRLRFLDLHHHFAFGKDRGGTVLDHRPGLAIVGVAGADAQARAAFHPDLVAMGGQFAHAFRGQADAVFVVLDFLDRADAHGTLLWPNW